MTTIADPLPLAHGPAWANRLALAPLTNTQSHPDGSLSEDEMGWLEARGRGGFGLVMTAAAYVAPAGQAWGGQLGISSDETHLPQLTVLAERLRATGTRSAVQLHHGGRRADPALTGRPNQCPWDDPEKQAVAMTTGEVEQLVADYVAAAARAERAGFDGVEVHGAHGYLLGQFLAGRNQRTDGYGGSLEHRMRVLVEILTGIRAVTGPAFQLGLRLTPEGSGVTLEEGRECARRMLATDLLDYLDMSLWDVFMKPRGGAPGLLIEHFTDLPRGATRLGVAGKVLSSADARWCLEQGADIVTVGMGAIRHHDFAARALADDDFVARPVPLTHDELRAEAIGPAFIDYLADGWPDVVAAG